jgi:uncharacterized low-complexity protein
LTNSPFRQGDISMSKLSTLTPIVAILALSVAGIAHADNPFAAKPMTGFKIADAAPMAASGAKEGSCGASKAKEGSCGADKAKAKKEGKCGEGKCGANKKKAKEGSCGADKAKKEGSCGANKAAASGA